MVWGPNPEDLRSPPCSLIHPREQRSIEIRIWHRPKSRDAEPTLAEQLRTWVLVVITASRTWPCSCRKVLCTSTSTTKPGCCFSSNGLTHRHTTSQPRITSTVQMIHAPRVAIPWFQHPPDPLATWPPSRLWAPCILEDLPGKKSGGWYFMP